MIHPSFLWVSAWYYCVYLKAIVIPAKAGIHKPVIRVAPYGFPLSRE